MRRSFDVNRKASIFWLAPKDISQPPALGHPLSGGHALRGRSGRQPFAFPLPLCSSTGPVALADAHAKRYFSTPGLKPPPFRVSGFSRLVVPFKSPCTLLQHNQRTGPRAETARWLSPRPAYLPGTVHLKAHSFRGSLSDYGTGQYDRRCLLKDRVSELRLKAR